MKTISGAAFGTILLLSAAGPAHANLVTNGNFGTGDFTGWTNPAGSGIGIDQSFPATGDTYDASFTGTGTLSQSIATTAGTSYTVSFSLLDESGLNSDTFTVGFGTFTDTITGDTANPYTTESFIVPAADITGTSTMLSFQAPPPGSSGTWNLDDVSVTAAAIPEPATGGLLAAAGLLVLSLAGRIRARRG